MPQPTDIDMNIAQRKFTDREKPQKSFRTLLATEQEYRVLHFYGVGGIGKSALQGHLMSEHLDRMSSTIYSYVDFDNPSHHDSATALRVLAKRFRSKFQVDFPLFEVAFAIYWSANNPEIELGEDKKLPFLEEGSILGSAVGLLDGGLTGIAISTIDYIYQKFPKQLDTKYLNDLKALPNKPIEYMKKRLALYLAQDIKRHIANKQISNCVILLDTYEALKNDKWIAKDLANNLNNQFMLVICGRDKLQWEERDSSWSPYIEQHLVGNLSPEDSAKFLISCGLEDEKIVEAITKASRGVPYYLDLCIDIYERIPNPTVEDFAVDHSSLFDRFMKYREPNEQETLKVLAHARYYTYELFCLLVEEFRTNYTITTFAEFNSYSFVSQDEERYTLHNLMRESLQEQTPDEISQRVREYLLSYYEKQFDSLSVRELRERGSEKLKEAFEEAYHYKSLLAEDTAELSSWLNDYTVLFYNKAEYSVIFDTLNEHIERLTHDRSESSRQGEGAILNNISQIYQARGDLPTALTYLQKSLNIYEEIGDKSGECVTLINIGSIHWERDQKKEAMDMWTNAYVIAKKIEYAQVLDALKSLAEQLGHKEGLEYWERVGGEGS